MKLVDILAQELKVWPEGVAAIAQGAATNELYDSSFQLIEPGIKVSMADDCGHPGYQAGAEFVTRAQWQAAVDALKADKIVYSSENVNPDIGYVTLTENPTNAECKITPRAWTGEGLPPVGTVVEVRRNGFGIREGSQVFLDEPVVVGGTFKMVHSGVDMAVVDGGEFRGADVFRADMLFPVRTPEQIAAEERKAALLDMLSLVPQHYNSPTEILAALYDAHYRKQEA